MSQKIQSVDLAVAKEVTRNLTEIFQSDLVSGKNTNEEVIQFQHTVLEAMVPISATGGLAR